jgi:hypothetical protein
VINTPPKISFRAQAAQNGQQAEEYVYKKFPNLEKINELIDAQFKNQEVEIKSCQQTITDNSHKSGTRTGRFLLNGEQHEQLLKNNGIYCFIVLKPGKNKMRVSKCFYVEAKAIKFNIKGLKTIPWNTLYEIRRRDKHVF